MDLGALIARVVVEDAGANRTLTLLMARLQSFGSEAGAAAAGTAKLDEGLASVSATANKTTASVERVSKSTTSAAAAQDRAAAASVRQAQAQAEVATVLTRVSGASVKVQETTLRQVAAQQRLAASSAAAGSAERAQAAETARLASAQAGLVAAMDRSKAAAEFSAARWTRSAQTMGAAGKTMTHAITLPVLAAAAVSVDQAAKFEKSTNVYVTAAGESKKNLEVVRKGIEDVATSTGTSIDKLTAGEYAIEKAGDRGAAGIVLLKAAAQGASEENANLADVISGATSVMASYHLGTDKSVQVINALKTGAGEAKTTMEEYVKSLSTVIPVASAAGVSISEVLGAISTLTQHGTNPAEATQELANTLRNLQAPSNVAVSAMNQLGISSVDVSKNLGKRGLSGTLEFIESKLPKTGLVYLTAMKQMEAGTKDLTVMTDKMPPSLAKLSKGFLDGSVSAKDYRKGIRDLGADGYAQGSAFLTLATRVKGYNDNLKAGSPQQKTMAAELKAIFGGAVGLNTALQLGGQNLDGFKGRVDAVSKSLHDGSSDVEGWQSTSKLASVEAGRLKESLRVLAIDGGNALLPMLVSAAHDLTGVVHGFQGLSGTQKELVGWSIGILAAVGPVLSIGAKLELLGARLRVFTVGAGNAFAHLGGSATGMSTGVTAAMGRVTAALGGAGIGLAIGSLTQNSSDATKAVGALGATATGALIGFGAGGPVGAAVGGLAGGLTSLATAFLGSGHNAEKAAADVQNFTRALDADSGALGRNLRATVAKSLQDSGALNNARKLGLNLYDVTSAAMGQGKALHDLTGLLKVLSISSYGATDAQQANSRAAALLLATLGGTNAEVNKAVQAYKNQKAAADGAAKGTRNTAAAAAGATPVLTALGNRSNGLSRALLALGRAHPVNVDTSSASGRIASLQSQVDTLFNSLLHPPAAKAPAAPSGSGLGGIVGAPVPKINKATGGTVSGPGTGTSDSVPAMLSNGEEVINAHQAAKHRGLLKAINAGVMGYAAGGTVGESVTGAAGTVGEVTRSGKDWVYKGIRYASQRAADNARTRDEQRAARASETLTASLPGITAVASIISSQKGPAAAAMRDLARAVSDAFQLRGVEKNLALVKTQIAGMTAYRGQVQSTLAGGFDLTKFGSIADLAQGFSGATGTNATFSAEVKKLSKEHLNKNFLDKLVAAGPNATLDTLASGSKADIARANKSFAAWGGSLNTAGDSAVMAHYGTSIAERQHRELALQGQQGKLVHSIDKLLVAVSRLTAHPSQIVLDGKVVGHTVVEPTVIKLLDELGHNMTYGRR